MFFLLSLKLVHFHFWMQLLRHLCIAQYFLNRTFFLLNITYKCQLVHTLPPHHIGLYRNDGLAVFKNVSGIASEKKKKKLIIFLQTKSPANSCRVELESRKSSWRHIYSKWWLLSTLSKAKWQNTLHSHPARSPTIYNQATSTVHWKALITIIIIKRYVLRNDTILWATSRQLWV